MTDEETGNPWYKQGLRFACTECGKCCTGGPGFVWVTEDEMNEMAKELAISVKEFKRLYTRQRDNKFALVEKKSQNHSCVFLENNKCRVYKARPTQCRTYPWWKENLTSPESWQIAKQYCEGIKDDAPLVAFSHIQENLHKK